MAEGPVRKLSQALIFNTALCYINAISLSIFLCFFPYIVKMTFCIKNLNSSLAYRK